jgi:hypothetical protein
MSANLELLRRHSECSGFYLLSDQLEELYLKLLQIVQNAAIAEWSHDPESKKIKKASLTEWIKLKMAEARYPAPGGSVDRLKTKMDEAGLAEYLETAIDQRQRYLKWLLKSKYLEIEDKDQIVGEVQAALHKLKSDLDSGAITEDGMAFHNRCLSALTAMQNVYFEKSATIAQLQGCMYELTNRCVHRFTEPKP